MYIKQIADFLNVKIKLPMKIYVDNVGALFLAKNPAATQRTRHIDVHYHYVRELIEKKLIEVEFVRSEDNLADPFTKNLGEESLNRLVKYVGTIENLDK